MTEKELVLKAIKDGEYEVEIEEPNNVCYHERYDGTPFYVMIGDDVKFGVWAGSCTVHVGEHSFTCDLDYGEWSGDDLLDDDDIVNALENADGVIWGEHLGTDGQWEVYSAANNITEDIPYFWCEDDECYKDVDSLDGYDEDIDFQYAEPGSDDWQDADVEANCGDIHALYLDLKERRSAELESGADIILSGDEIKAASESLYETIMDQARYETSEEGEPRVRLKVSRDFFDRVL